MAMRPRRSVLTNMFIAFPACRRTCGAVIAIERLRRGCVEIFYTPFISAWGQEAKLPRLLPSKRSDDTLERDM